jgi:small subunit ribosomal protein S5
MGLVPSKKSARELFPQYTSIEKEALKDLYTPAQIAAIEAGEAAINPEDLKKRGVIRTDLGAVPYVDDFSRTRPIFDRVQPYEGPMDPNPRIMDLQEAMDELDRAFEKVKQGHKPPEPVEDPEDPEYQAQLFPSRLELMKIHDEASFLMGSDGKAVPSHKNTILTAPTLPKKFLEDEGDEDGEGKARSAAKKAKDEKTEAQEMAEADPRDPDGTYNRLMKQTGMTLDDIFDLKIKMLVRHRVVNQTRLGKIASQYCLAIAGDGKGRLGIGEAKGQESEDTYANARIAAIRAMRPIPRYEDRTIFGDVEGKMSAVVVKLMARPPGKKKILDLQDLTASNTNRIWIKMPASHF